MLSRTEYCATDSLLEDLKEFWVGLASSFTNDFFSTSSIFLQGLAGELLLSDSFLHKSLISCLLDFPGESLKLFVREFFLFLEKEALDLQRETAGMIFSLSSPSFWLVLSWCRFISGRLRFPENDSHALKNSPFSYNIMSTCYV